MRSIKLMIVFTLTFLPFLAIAQTDAGNGIRFESDLNWTQILVKAKAENKYIFVDCYATWCGPCKWMSANIFQDKEVGDYMNAHFINVAVQMDKTAKDDHRVKDWYADADKLHDLYKIGAYPTYLFFSPDGTALHRFTGLRGNIKAFLDGINEAFDPAKQYYGLIKQWKSHKNDTTFLFNLYSAAMQQRNDTLTDSIGEAYLNGQPDLLTIKNIRLIIACNLIQSSKDKWFCLFLNNAAKINTSVNDSTAVARKLSGTVFKEEILPLYFGGRPLYWNITKENIRKKYPAIGQSLVLEVQGQIEDHVQQEISTIIRMDKKGPDWNQITKTLKQKYPDFNLDLRLITAQIWYYADRELWPETADAVYKLITKYSNQISDGQVNSMSWEYVFMHTSSPKILSAAQKAMSEVLKKNFNPVYVDTYANILYKLGKRDEALKWENKAIETSIKNNGDLRDLNDFKTNLAKMKKDQPTWVN
jgi:thioredoxin-related protein